MTINFHDPKNRFTYTKREATSSWLNFMKGLLDWEGKQVVDLGCGIYSKSLLELGASKVIGIYSSAEMLKGANLTHMGEAIQFQLGDAYQTELCDESIDLVFQRALIHHLPDLSKCFLETKRILKPGGVTIIQNRTPEDCLLPGSQTHLRGYFFEKFPKLIDLEIKRRYTDEEVKQALAQAGLVEIRSYSFWETRKIFTSVDEIVADLTNRVGRSILHALSDVECKKLADYIVKQPEIEPDRPITEQDRWTIWIAYKE